MESKNATQSELQILSKLAATRNIIKNKFRRAYIDRKKRERKITKALKPITKKIDSLKPTEETKSELSKKEKENGSITSEILLSESLASVNTSDSDDGNVSDGNNASLQFYTPAPKKFSRQASESSDDDVERRTQKTMGQTSSATMAWRNLSDNARGQRSEHKQRVLDFTSSPKAQQILERDSRRREQMIQEAGISSRTRSSKKPRGMGSRTRSKIPIVKKTQGSGVKTYDSSIGFNFIPYHANDHIIYEYFNNPNELCDRLRLLVSSRMAGNTNHMQEINSIIEELRELGCIV